MTIASTIPIPVSDDRHAPPVVVGLKLHIEGGYKIWIERRVVDTTIAVSDKQDKTYHTRIYVIYAILPIEFPKLKEGFFLITTGDPEYEEKPYFLWLII